MSNLVSLAAEERLPAQPAARNVQAVDPEATHTRKGRLLLNNQDFTQKVYQARVLGDFILFANAKNSDVGFDLPTLGYLNAAYYHPKGREPRQEEWEFIDNHLVELRGRTSDEFIQQNRARFFINSLIFSRKSATTFLGLCIISLIIAMAHRFLPDASIGNLLLNICYITWLVSLGGLGSIAYIFVNVLAIHVDATFDISSKSLLRLRIYLGCLSGLIIGMPFGRDEFIQFIGQVSTAGLHSNNDLGALFLMLLPFVLGFSTSFLMVVLKRLGDSLQVIFGGSVYLPGDGPQPKSEGGVERRPPHRRSASRPKLRSGGEP